MYRVGGSTINPNPGIPPVIPGIKINPLPGIPPVIPTVDVNPLPGIPPIITKPKPALPPVAPLLDIPPNLITAPPQVAPKIITPPTGILIPKKFDISSATEQDLMDMLKAGDKLHVNPRFAKGSKELEHFKNQDRARLMALYGDIAGNESKLSRTLDKLIREKYGFSENTSVEDMYKIIGPEMGVKDLPLLKQEWTDNSYGSYNPRITDSGRINISGMSQVDGVTANTIAHEFRHKKELGSIGNSIDWNVFNQGKQPFGGQRIYEATKLGSNSENKVGDALLTMQTIAEENNKRHWPGLSDLYKETSNKNPKYIDALDVVDYLEKPHFKTSFLAENLRRLGKGLSPISNAVGPYIGPIGAALGALSYSDPSSAAVDMIMPGGLEELGGNEDNEIMADRKYRSANLIPNVRMLGNYTDAPDTGRYHESIRKLQGRKK